MMSIRPARSSVNTLVNRDSGGCNKRGDSYFVSAAHAVPAGDGSPTMPGRVASMTRGGSMTSAVYARYFPFCQRIRSPHCFPPSARPFDILKRLFAGIDIAVILRFHSSDNDRSLPRALVDDASTHAAPIKPQSITILTSDRKSSMIGAASFLRLFPDKSTATQFFGVSPRNRYSRRVATTPIGGSNTRKRKPSQTSRARIQHFGIGSEDQTRLR